MPVTQLDPDPQLGPTVLRPYMKQREPFIGSTVYVFVEVTCNDEPVARDLKFTISSPDPDGRPAYRVQPMELGTYVLIFRAAEFGLYSVLIETTDSAPATERYEFMVRG